jgi:DNA-binding beta-propeller fold protein YncE
MNLSSQRGDTREYPRGQVEGRWQAAHSMNAKRMLVVGFVVGLVVYAMARGPAVQTAGSALKKTAQFDLPGPPGKRFDYLTINADQHYLLSAHLAAGQTYVIDLRTNQVVAIVADTPGVEGVEYVPELKKFYTSNAGDNTIGVVDLRQMKVIKKIPTEVKPDGSAYAAPFHKLYVSDERGKAEAIVDVTRDEVIKTLHFDSETGMPQYDPVARKVYVNLQDQNVFAVIDPVSDTVVARYPVGRCRGNHGMALDPEHHRAFLSCEGNNLMAVFDLDKHQSIAFLPMADGPDVIKFDPGLGRIYVACYSGAISVFHQDDPNRYRKIEDFKVQHAVHSLAVDPETHRVYTPEQEENGKPVARMIVYDAVTGQ